jgi:tetratricopeptide (TPR) repeat protein
MVDPLLLKFPRHSYQQHFATAFAQLGQSPHNVLVFYGEAGLGKSTLRNQLETESSPHAIALSGALLKRYTEVAADPALHHLQTQLKQTGIDLQDFDRVNAYWSEWARLGQDFDPDQLADQMHQGALLNPAADLMQPLKLVPGTVSTLTSFLLRFSYDYGQQQDILQELNACLTPHELRQKLPKYLMHTLQLALQDQNRAIAILVDDYDDLLNHQGRCPWLEDLMAVENPSLLWVLFAQDEIATLPPAQQIQLQPLTEQESLDWLRSWEIDDPETAQAIATAAQGSPLELRYRVEAYQSDPDIATEDFEAVGHEIMSALPLYLIEAVCCLSVARSWNQKFCTDVAHYFSCKDKDALFSELIELPFIEPLGADQWRVHPLMDRYLQQEFPDLHQAVVHEFWYEYALKQCIEHETLEGLSDIVYHGMRGNHPEVAGGSILTILAQTQAKFRHLEAIAMLRLVKGMELRLVIELRAMLAIQLGTSQAQLGRWDDAIATLEQAQSLWASPKNRVQMPVDAIEFYLARAYFQVGRIQEAHHAALRAKHLRIDRSGADSPYVAQVWNLLGDIAERQDQLQEAFDCTEQALRIFLDHTDTLAFEVIRLQRSQILRLRQLDRLEEALQRAQSALEFAETTSGTEHADVILGLEQLGMIYEALSQLDAAYAHYTQALAMGEPLLGVDHPVVLSLLQRLTQLCRKLGKPEAAEAFAQRHTTNMQIGRFESTAEAAQQLHHLAASLQAKGVYRKQSRFTCDRKVP